MPGASPVALRWVDFSLGIHKTADEISILVVNLIHFIVAEKTRFFFSFSCVVIFVIHNDLNRESVSNLIANIRVHWRKIRVDL